MSPNTFYLLNKKSFPITRMHMYTCTDLFALEQENNCAFWPWLSLPLYQSVSQPWTQYSISKCFWPAKWLCWPDQNQTIIFLALPLSSSQCWLVKMIFLTPLLYTIWKAYVSGQTPVDGFLQILDKEVMQEAMGKKKAIHGSSTPVINRKSNLCRTQF